jgi:peptidoglycan/LPS O-acetylase OafA/YrhL
MQRFFGTLSGIIALVSSAFPPLRRTGGGARIPETGVDRYRADIQGLRAVAILLVVVYHAVPWAIPGGFVGVDVFFVISGFLITRQLLADKNLPSRGSISSFYARRARRILPAATLTTIVTLIASALLLSPLDVQRVIGDAWASTAFVINYRLAAQANNYLTSSLPPSPLMHYWSLSVEEQFYLLWPGLLSLVLLVGRQRRHSAASPPAASPPVASPLAASPPAASPPAASPPTANPPAGRQTVLVAALLAVIASSLATSVLLTRSDPVWAFYALWTRAFELGIGALVAVLATRFTVLSPRVRIATGWAGMVAIGIAAAAFRDSMPFPGVAALLPVLGAAAVIVAGVRADPLGAGAEGTLGVRPMQWIGARSYSWYLWHFPFLVLAPAVAGHALSSAAAVAVAAMSLGVAAVTYACVEQPFRRAPVLIARPRRGLAVGLGAVICATVTAVAITATLPSLVGSGRPTHLVSSFASPVGRGLTTAQVEADVVRAAQTEAVPSNMVPPLYQARNDLPLTYHDGCHLPFATTSGPPCVFGDTDSATTVVLFGDSHAAQWFPALDLIATRRNWRLVSLTKSGCPPVDVVLSRNHLPFPQCGTWRRYEEARIVAMKPALVITSWYDWFTQDATADPSAPHGYGSFWLDGVAGTFLSLRKSGAEVVYIEETPIAPVDDPSCVSTHLADADFCEARPQGPGFDKGVGLAEDDLATKLGVRRINPTSWFCTTWLCPAVVGNILVRRDNGHMTPQYSTFLAPVLDQTLAGMLDRDG